MKTLIFGKRSYLSKELNKKIAIPGENLKTNLIAPIQEYAYSLMKDINGVQINVA